MMLDVAAVRQPSTARLRGAVVGLAAMAAMLGPAAAGEDARGALDRLLYARRFNAIRDRLSADEAARAAREARAPAAPWASAGDPPPSGTSRDVPAGGYGAVVARASPGSWREAGDGCAMTGGGRIEVLGSEAEVGALVRYGRPVWSPAAGGDCPDGTLAFVPTAVLFDWPMAGAVEAERRAAAARLGAAADRILGGPSAMGDP